MQVVEKPRTLEATRCFKQGDHPSVIFSPHPDGIGRVFTNSGIMYIHPGDWLVIDRITGSKKVVKNEVFEFIYQQVD